jgi:gamma-glutamylputrescine oxidase
VVVAYNGVHGAPHTIWQELAALPAPSLPCVRGEISCEVVVVGAGITGLTAAHSLAQSGIDCVVVEANDVGWGASGRTTGYVVPRFKVSFAKLAEEYGAEIARRLHRILLDGIDTLETLAYEFGPPGTFVRCGFMAPAQSNRALADLESDRRWLEAEANDSVPAVLGRSATREELGTDAYTGAYVDVRGGALQPLDHVRGLAKSLTSRGVRIFVASPVVAIEDTSDGVAMKFRDGRVRAQRAIIATNAYTAGIAGLGDLQRRIVPVSSSVVVTSPLPPSIAAAILPTRRVASDTKRLLNAFRILPGNRLMFSGRGDITGRRDTPSVYRNLERAMVATFPEVSGTEIALRWSGMVAVTRDHLPHLGRLSERIIYGLGYGGRGVALATVFGSLLARMARGEYPFMGPFGDDDFKPFAFHNLRVPGMRLMARYYRLRDQISS